jgi:hypothetical protein
MSKQETIRAKVVTFSRNSNYELLKNHIRYSIGFDCNDVTGHKNYDYDNDTNDNNGNHNYKDNDNGNDHDNDDYNVKSNYDGNNMSDNLNVGTNSLSSHLEVDLTEANPTPETYSTLELDPSRETDPIPIMDITRYHTGEIEPTHERDPIPVKDINRYPTGEIEPTHDTDIAHKTDLSCELDHDNIDLTYDLTDEIVSTDANPAGEIDPTEAPLTSEIADRLVLS